MMTSSMSSPVAPPRSRCKHLLMGPPRRQCGENAIEDDRHLGLCEGHLPIGASCGSLGRRVRCSSGQHLVWSARLSDHEKQCTRLQRSKRKLSTVTHLAKSTLSSSSSSSSSPPLSSSSSPPPPPPPSSSSSSSRPSSSAASAAARSSAVYYAGGLDEDELAFLRQDRIRGTRKRRLSGVINMELDEHDEDEDDAHDDGDKPRHHESQEHGSTKTPSSVCQHTDKVQRMSEQHKTPSQSVGSESATTPTTTTTTATASASKADVRSRPAPRDLSKQEVWQVWVTVHRILRRHPMPPMDERVHASFSSLFADKTKIKHVAQESSIIAHMDQAGILNLDKVFVEFGAGKGSLSRHIQRVCSGHSDHLLVDRIAFRSRNCFDNSMKKDATRAFKAKSGQGTATGSGSPASSSVRMPVVRRVLADILDLDLHSLPEVRGRHVVALSKHLCGAATDISLSCVMRSRTAPLLRDASAREATRAADSSANGRSSDGTARHAVASDGHHGLGAGDDDGHVQGESDDEKMEADACGGDDHSLPHAPAVALSASQESPAGMDICIATCCHHLCTWGTYINRPFMRFHGIDRGLFERIACLSSWATLKVPGHASDSSAPTLAAMTSSGASSAPSSSPSSSAPTASASCASTSASLDVDLGWRNDRGVFGGTTTEPVPVAVKISLDVHRRHRQASSSSADDGRTPTNIHSAREDLAASALDDDSEEGRMSMQRRASATAQAAAAAAAAVAAANQSTDLTTARVDALSIDISAPLSVPASVQGSQADVAPSGSVPLPATVSPSSFASSGADVGSRAGSVPVSTPVASSVRALALHEKRKLGYMCKHLLDLGRLDYLRNFGHSGKIVRFTRQSHENFLLLSSTTEPVANAQ